jgi:PncC family amidohydrolase
MTTGDETLGNTRRLTDRPNALARQVHERLVTSGLTLALAESCTGGLIADLITDISGSSAYFLGSAVTYANSAKQGMVGVRAETLAAHGAVSAETAAEMAQGARRAYGADIGASVTGIAGPTGATPGKPVGLVYIHLSAEDAEWGERHVWNGDRLANKALSAEAVLRMMLDYLSRDPAANG